MKQAVILGILVVIGAAAGLAVRRRLVLERMTDPAGKPTAQMAAKRTLCLALLVLRAKAEYGLHPVPGDLPSTDEPADPGFAERQNAWLKKEGGWEAASRQERTLFQKKLGTWTQHEIADGQWREEALGVLLWALHPVFATCRTQFLP